MQASINVPKLSKYRGRLAAGTMFSLAGFDVVLSKQTRMTTDSTLLIRFNGTTVFDVITEPHSPIPKEAFRFRNETDLLSLANTNSQFPGDSTNLFNLYPCLILIKKIPIRHCG